MNSDEQRTHSPLVTKRDARDDQYVLESLLGRAALNAFRAHDASLRRVYAHYATLEMYSASTKKITWRVIEATGATLNCCRAERRFGRGQERVRQKKPAKKQKHRKTLPSDANSC